MLDKLETAQMEANQAQIALFDLFERSIDGIYRSTPDGRYLYVNNSMVKMLGYGTKDDLLKVNTAKLYANPAERPDHNNRNKTFETRLIKKDGTAIFVEISSRVSFKDSKPVYYDGIVRDITKNKNYEEKIEYLSFHDKLTGLFNRAYFDEEIRRLSRSRHLPVTVIFCDLNGLKKINDTYGHLKGDLLLKRFAKILKECFRSEDIIARIGGDEFCIILVKTTEQESEKIIERVKDKCNTQHRGKILIEFAYGIKSKTSAEQNIQKIIKSSEMAMYENKKNKK